MSGREKKKEREKATKFCHYHHLIGDDVAVLDGSRRLLLPFITLLL